MDRKCTMMRHSFSQRVYEAVKQIPSGQVATYGEIAWRIGAPRAARQVGQALAHCKDPATPCHRVVNAKGDTAPGYAEQAALLEAEGVPFLSDGRVDLKNGQKSGERHERKKIRQRWRSAPGLSKKHPTMILRKQDVDRENRSPYRFGQRRKAWKPCCCRPGSKHCHPAAFGRSRKSAAAGAHTQKRRWRYRRFPAYAALRRALKRRLCSMGMLHCVRYPPAGAKHAIETIVLVRRVKGLAPGLYRYLAKEHALGWLGETTSDWLCALDTAFTSNRFQHNSAVTFFWIAVPERMVWHHGQRGYRNLYLDAGHIGQNFYLAAEGLGLAACTMCVFDDVSMKRLLRLEGDQFLVYTAAAGQRQPEPAAP